MAIPVHIVGGFLGTGKTTLIRDQLQARRGEQLAILVNDFGEASLDEATLASARPFEITNIPGGCVCCTAPEGFIDALGEIVDRKPDRLLIEPTGLARPQDLVDTIRRSPHARSLEIAPVLVVVDPARLARASEQEQALVAHQAEIADVLIANRTDLCDDEALARFDAFAARLWPGPISIHKTTQGRIPAELMEWPPGEGARLPREAQGPAASHASHVPGSAESHASHVPGSAESHASHVPGSAESHASHVPGSADGHASHVPGSADGHASHDHDSTEGFEARSWRWSPDRVFSRERLARAVMRLGEGLAGAPLVRFKGIFRTDEGFVLLELAGGTLHEARSLHRRDSRADAIFRRGEAEPFERASSWLHAAVLSNQDLEARTHQIEIALPDGRVRIVERDALVALPDGLPDVSSLVPGREGAAARLEALWTAEALPPRGSAILCAADGFTSEPLPIAALRQGVLLHSMAGEALPPGKGGPFRLLIPEGVPDAPSGCANVKGVVRIVLKDEAAA